MARKSLKKLAKELFGFVPVRYIDYIEYIIENYIEPERIPYIPMFLEERIPKVERKISVVFDTSVLGFIVLKCESRTDGIAVSHWKNCLEVIKMVEEKKIEGYIVERSLEALEKVLNKVNWKKEERLEETKELMLRSFKSLSQEGVRVVKEPPFDEVVKKLGYLTVNREINSKDIYEDLPFILVAIKRGIKHVLTYDKVLLSKEFQGQLKEEHTVTMCTPEQLLYGLEKDIYIKV